MEYSWHVVSDSLMLQGETGKDGMDGVPGINGTKVSLYSSLPTSPLRHNLAPDWFVFLSISHVYKLLFNKTIITSHHVASRLKVRLTIYSTYQMLSDM